MTLTRPEAIVFDWDNTLVDSWPTIHAANQATFRAFGVPEWTLAETKSKVARSLRDAFPPIFGERWQEAGEYYRKAFSEIHIQTLTPLPGVEAMLEELHESGIKLAVVSNKTGNFLRREGAHLGWDRWFARMVGAQDAHADKPHAAPLLMALEAAGVEPGEGVWMVGDSVVDLDCAINGGCIPILMRPEAAGEAEFPNNPPRHHFVDSSALIGLVRGLISPIS